MKVFTDARAVSSARPFSLTPRFSGVPGRDVQKNCFNSFSRTQPVKANQSKSKPAAACIQRECNRLMLQQARVHPISSPPAIPAYSGLIRVNPVIFLKKANLNPVNLSVENRVSVLECSDPAQLWDGAERRGHPAVRRLSRSIAHTMTLREFRLIQVNSSQFKLIKPKKESFIIFF